MQNRELAITVRGIAKRVNSLCTWEIENNSMHSRLIKEFNIQSITATPTHYWIWE